MRILQLCSISNMAYGASQSVATLAEGLVERGHQVIFACYEGREFIKEIRSLGYDVRPIPNRRKVDFNTVRVVADLCCTEGIDVMHTHLSSPTLNGSIAGRRARVPTVASVHGLNNRWTYMFATHIITVSEASRRQLIRQLIPASRITTVHNALPLSRWSELLPRDVAKAKFGYSPTTPVVAFVSRTSSLKGMDIALRAFARVARQIPDARLLVAGHSKEHQQMDALSRQLGLGERVQWLGFYAQVMEVFSACNVFLFPSQTESLPISVLEAMAAARPVVASNVGGVPEMLPRDAGRLLAKRDVAGFADSVAELLADEEKAAMLGNCGREIVKDRFSVEAMASGVERVYEMLLASRRA